MGVFKYSPFGKITEEFYDSIFDVNVKGLLFTVQKALPLMPDGGSVHSQCLDRGQQRLPVE
jgi:NAD(P)-dependent dehydrogenase (short-subunit alcohol dehydrogenase family)